MRVTKYRFFARRNRQFVDALGSLDIALHVVDLTVYRFSGVIRLYGAMQAQKRTISRAATRAASTFFFLRRYCPSVFSPARTLVAVVVPCFKTYANRRVEDLHRDTGSRNGLLKSQPEMPSRDFPTPRQVLQANMLLQTL